MNDNKELSNNGIIKLAALLVFIITFIEVITLGLGIDNYIVMICCFSQQILLIVILLEIWKFVRKKNKARSNIVLGCIIFSFLFSIFTLIMFIGIEKNVV